MKLLYVLGSARSGSTIVANVLEKIPGFFSAGELRFLWARIGENRRCGCGDLVRECALWSRVIASVDLPPGLTPPALATLERHELRLRRTPALLTHRPASTMRGPLGQYMSVTSEVLRALDVATGARVLIDTSKRPSNGAAMRFVPGVDVWFLHLVRDPRAVTFSRSQPKRNPDRDGGEMPVSSLRSSVAHWSATNLAADLVRGRHGATRSMFLRYEDFVDHPAAFVHRIARWLGEQDGGSIVEARRMVDLGVNHTVSGNPGRFRTGEIELRRDDRWRSRMNQMSKVSVTVATAPLLLKYGYRLKPSGRITEGVA